MALADLSPQPEILRVACVQVNATNDEAANIDEVSRIIREAAADGAQFVATPECVCLMTWGRQNAWDRSHAFADHLVVQSLGKLAAELNIWLLIGSVFVRLTDGKLANRSVLVSNTGTIIAHYDKIHMFDVSLENGEVYRESDSFKPGDVAVLAETPFGGVGLSVCYDVRFAALYRTLAQAGARLITVPAAFTKTTGKAHWHTLLRARAIETGCYVLAPAQVGHHEGGRETFGHALIVDPWGEVLADGGQDVGYVCADLALNRVEQVRTAVPAWGQNQAFTLQQQC